VHEKNLLFKKFHCGTYEKMSSRIKDQNQRHVPVSMHLIQAKACFIYEVLSTHDHVHDGGGGGGDDDDDGDLCNVSSGWFLELREEM
jgi:hypothetical protein